jgi:hypothetical protein
LRERLGDDEITEQIITCIPSIAVVKGRPTPYNEHRREMNSPGYELAPDKSGLMGFLLMPDSTETVTYVFERVLPIFPVYTPGEGRGTG